MITIKNREKWVENFARTGIFAKGIVYCLIGLLTSMAALGLQGRKMDKEDAFRLIYNQPFGKMLALPFRNEGKASNFFLQY